MPLGQRIRAMGFGLPDIGKIQGDLNAKFGELADRLDRIIELLTEIRDQRKTQ